MISENKNENKMNVSRIDRCKISFDKKKSVVCLNAIIKITQCKDYGFLYLDEAGQVYFYNNEASKLV